MAIEMQYSGKDDKVGKCVVTIGGKTKITGEGEQARIVALMEIDSFEKTELDKKELTEAYDDLLRKAKDRFSLKLEDGEASNNSGEVPETTPKGPRYKAVIDGEEFYRGDDLQSLRTEISNIPEPKFGP
ncbi:hypothetical protein HFO43_02530 [Rhizobium leguminosarum]|uniref:hypothetical protein n=1 Tax=Rhizobium leguminosarum TaxID=384 RepID=UPI001C978339|nr:hypothetical protein [Rhizobium leguminosarum]MBY5667452.1 hypothetical protein [Rhizobium leguminosarum]